MRSFRYINPQHCLKKPYIIMSSFIGQDQIRKIKYEKNKNWKYIIFVPTDGFK